MAEEKKIDGPLEFGNKEHIGKIRAFEKEQEKEELRSAFNELPDCVECDGRGKCGKCGAFCEECFSIGKQPRAYSKFISIHPEWDA